MAGEIHSKTEATAADIAADSKTWFGVEYDATGAGSAFVPRKMEQREVRELMSFELNVMDYGAKGDGATDDSTAFQNAVNAISTNVNLGTYNRPSVGGRLIIPAATYLLGTAISIPNNVNISIQGECYAATILQASGINYIFTLADSTNTQHAIEILDLTLYLGGIAIGENYRRYGRIQNVQIVDSPQWGIDIEAGCVEWTLEKVTISEQSGSAYGGVRLQPSLSGKATDLVTLRKCAFVRNAGIDFHAENPSFRLEHCDFEVKATGSESNPFVNIEPGTVHGTFDNCRFSGETNPPDAMFRVGATIGSSRAEGLVLHNCIFMDNSGSAITAIELNHPVSDMRIAHCKVGSGYDYVIDEAFATSLANSSASIRNYLDVVLEDEGATPLFSSAGIGWNLTAHLENRQPIGPTVQPDQNLLASPLDFNTSWTLESSVTASRTITDPWGNANAGTELSTTGGASSAYQTVNINGRVTLGIWAKAGNSDTMRLSIRDAANHWEIGSTNNIELTSDWRWYSFDDLATGARTGAIVTIYLGTHLITPLNGDSIHVFLPQLSYGRNATAYELDGEVNARWLGARGDGVTYDQDELQDALDLFDRVYLPAGTYLSNSSLTVDGTKHIRGDGIDVTKIATPSTITLLKVNSGAAVTTQYGSIRDLTLEGTSTADIGMQVGQVTTSPYSANHWNFDRLRITGFDTAGAYLYASQINFFTQCYFDANEDGVFVDQDGSGSNTDTIFRDCTFRSNLGRGVFMQGCQHFTFDHCTFESNDEEGLYVDRETAGTVGKALYVVRCYFESNNDGRGSGDYGQLYLHSTGGALTDAHVDKCYFGTKGTGNHHIKLGVGRFFVHDNFADDDTLGESTNTTQCRVDIRSRYATSAFVLNNASITGTYELIDINNGVKDFYHAVSSAWTQQSYTPSNPTTLRSYDCDATTTAELADVLSTLIADLQDRGLIG